MVVGPQLSWPGWLGRSAMILAGVGLEDARAPLTGLGLGAGYRLRGLGSPEWSLFLSLVSHPSVV